MSRSTGTWQADIQKALGTALAHECEGNYEEALELCSDLWERGYRPVYTPRTNLWDDTWYKPSVVPTLPIWWQEYWTVSRIDGTPLHITHYEASPADVCRLTCGNFFATKEECEAAIYKKPSSNPLSWEALQAIVTGDNLNGTKTKLYYPYFPDAESGVIVEYIEADTWTGLPAFLYGNFQVFKTHGGCAAWIAKQDKREKLGEGK